MSAKALFLFNSSFNFFYLFEEWYKSFSILIFPNWWIAKTNQTNRNDKFFSSDNCKTDERKQKINLIYDVLAEELKRNEIIIRLSSSNYPILIFCCIGMPDPG